MTRLQTKYNRAIRAAIRARTGYARVSNVRLMKLTIPCVRCGKELHFSDHGTIDCYSATDEDRGCYSFDNWPSRRYELRQERRRRSRCRAENAKTGPWWIRYVSADRKPMHWAVDGRGRPVAVVTRGEENEAFWRAARGDS